MNLDPNIWGPHGWFFLDSIMLSLPENPNKETQHNLAQFLKYVAKFLPCEKCRIHFSGLIQDIPSDMSKDETLKWWLSVRNSARVIAGHRPFTEDEYDTYYTNAYNKKTYTSLYYLIALLIFIIIVYTLKKKY